VAEPGLRVNGKFYPLPSSYTLGEAEVVERVTGMNVQQFTEALPKQAQKEHQDVRVLIAFVWHAMHRENPDLTVDEVRALEFDDLNWEGLDEGDAADPPPETSAKNDGTSPPSAETANDSQVTELAPIRAASGTRP
jgi:hypothetical protein